MKLSFYTPIAYDYKYAIASIMSYYDIADEIFLMLDEDKISWSNKKYELDNVDLDRKIHEIDVDKKIHLKMSNFHKLQHPIENETAERNYISQDCKKDNYIIGIDSDEVLLNPLEFANWLNQYSEAKFDISCTLLSIYKVFADKLLITLPHEDTRIGTNLVNCYKKCRLTSNRLSVKSPLQILHFSWGRSRQEVVQKLSNWGHSKDFDILKYLEIWDSVTLDNYQEKVNLHPLKLKQWWQKLELLDLQSFNLSEKLREKIRCFQS